MTRAQPRFKSWGVRIGQSRIEGAKRPKFEAKPESRAKPEKERGVRGVVSVV